MKKLSLKKRKKQIEAPSRITNETVAEHREEILAGGRKFKYPHQYERHRLVFNVLIIGIVTLLLMCLLVWWQLYPMQNTSTFFYRLTRIVPLPVASVDGTQVRYSDYLMSLSGSLHYLEQSERLNLSSEDGKRQIEFIKRQALDGAIADTYAAKVAAEKGITVSDQKINDAIDASLNTVSGRISQDVYDNSTLSTFGYTTEEYRHLLHRSLIRQEVAYVLDTKATSTKKAIDDLMTAKPKLGLDKVVEQLHAKGYKNIQAGSSGMVPKTNHDYGLTQTASKLKKGEVSKMFRSTNGDGYYIVQLTESNEKQLAYNFLKVPLTALGDQLKTLTKSKKIQEYITIKQGSGQVIRR